jgi:predicted aspartyl protease
MKKCWSAFLFCLTHLLLNAQEVEVYSTIPKLPPPEKVVSAQANNWNKVEIPFEYVNDLIIVEVMFNQFLPLKFIFDTGAEHTILTKREITDLQEVAYERRFKLVGADLSTELYAYLAKNINLKIGRLMSPNEAILVLEEDYFRYEELTGIEIHGIIGASFFKRFIVEIDYQKQTIILFNPITHRLNTNKFTALDIEIYRSKPYLYADLNIVGDSTQRVKLLIDTGAGLSLLLYTHTDTSLFIPPNAIPGNVGRGLGGYLEGYSGRVSSLSFAGFSLNNIITSFQEADSLVENTMLNDRNGILGNNILYRFRVVINYWEGKLYLKPNKLYKEDFPFNRSGLMVVASGKSLNTFTIQFVVPNSPSGESGIQKGDVIKRINSMNTKFLKLSEVIDRLQKKEGKKVNLVLQRGEETIKTRIQLRDIL